MIEVWDRKYTRLVLLFHFRTRKYTEVVDLIMIPSRIELHVLLLRTLKEVKW